MILLNSVALHSEKVAYNAWVESEDRWKEDCPCTNYMPINLTVFDPQPIARVVPGLQVGQRLERAARKRCGTVLIRGNDSS